MSIFGKLFKKKDDDFSFDSTSSFPPPETNDTFSATTPTDDPFSATTPTDDPFGTPGTSFGDPVDPLAQPAGTPDPFATADPFASTNPSSSPQPTQQHANPLPPIEDSSMQSRGSQIAQNYIDSQQPSTQPTPTNSTLAKDPQAQANEMINLKLDAIKSQLELLNQRLEKVENGPKKLWR